MDGIMLRSITIIIAFSRTMKYIYMQFTVNWIDRNVHVSNKGNNTGAEYIYREAQTYNSERYKIKGIIMKILNL